MSQIIKKFITDNAVGAAKIRLENASILKARNAANTADVSMISVNAANELQIDNGVIVPALDNSVPLGSSTKRFSAGHVRQMMDSSNQVSVDVQTRELKDTGSTAIADYATPGILKLIATNLNPFTDNAKILGTSILRYLEMWVSSIKNTGQINIESSGSNIKLGVQNAGDVEVKDLSNTGAPSLRLFNNASTFGVRMKAPGTLAANYSLTLPVDDGNSGEVLRTDGAGILSWVAAATAESRAKETFTLLAADITNQFVTLANSPMASSVHFIVKGGAPTLEGAAHDYSVVGAQVNFLNDLATGGAAALVAGDIVQVVYEY